MLKSYVQITTADTRKTYTFPPPDGTKNPQVWAIRFEIIAVQDGSGYLRYSNNSCTRDIFVERQTLVNAKVCQVADGDKKPTQEEEETVESLILRLLAKLGIEPQA